MKESSLRNNLAVVISSSYILLFSSEYFFVNEEPSFSLIDLLTKDPAALFALVEFTLFYGIPTYFMLMVIESFALGDIYSLFLAASLYGWILEGAIISQMYEALPWSISWTPLGWHGLVDVLFVWYFIPRVLRRYPLGYCFLLFSCMGLFWGTWACWFWKEGSHRIAAPDFLLFTFFTSTVLALAFLVLDRTQARFRTSKRERLVISAFVLSIIFLQSIPDAFLPIILLLPLCSLSIFILWKGEAPKNEKILPSKSVITPKAKLLTLLALPSCASLTYYFHFNNFRILPLLEVLPPLLLLAGFLVYLIAAMKLLLRH